MDQNNQPINVLEVAKAQKGILWCLIAMVISMFFLQILYIPIILINLYFTFKLLTSLKLKYIVLWLIGMLIPLLNFILLLVLNSQATKAIKVQGFKVGLMGANLGEIRARMSQTPSSIPMNK